MMTTPTPSDAQPISHLLIIPIVESVGDHYSTPVHTHGNLWSAPPPLSCASDQCRRMSTQRSGKYYLTMTMVTNIVSVHACVICICGDTKPHVHCAPTAPSIPTSADARQRDVRNSKTARSQPRSYHHYHRKRHRSPPPTRWSPLACGTQMMYRMPAIQMHVYGLYLYSSY